MKKGIRDVFPFYFAVSITVIGAQVICNSQIKNSVYDDKLNFLKIKFLF